MDQDAPLASVNKAAEKLDRAAKASKGNVDMMSQLLQSIEDFKARIAPLFEKVRKQEEDLQAARREALRQLQDRQTLENRLVRASALRAENAQLRGQLATSNQVAEEMTVAGQQMKDEMLALQNELASYKKIASDLDVDKRRMADQLERNANAARTAKEKYKRAKQDNDELQKRLATAEERQREAPTSPMSSQLALYEDYDDELGFRQPMSSQAPVRPPPPIDNEFSWEGIARPGFGSDWQLNRNKENHGVLKKNRPVGGPTHRRVTNPIVPLRLNNKGQPTTAVHIGPKRNLRAF
ncbi:hypothetical protein BKA70DRAFT_1418677 [Coprinopsis sp. MPI-PUGE-AT-0042]|nr:hypothetical protein BKA70DRAFT_1418677 [Coprinopsis sp. MPI-PUGE-AT-0042]